jgi:hypothetical protein
VMHANLKYVRGQPMLIVDQLCQAGQYCVELHNYYIQNYKTNQDIIVQYKDLHFLVGGDIFVVTFYDLYDVERCFQHRCVVYFSHVLFRIVSP